MQRSKAGLGPHWAARFVNQLINAAGDTVINQVQHLAVRVEVESELGFVRQLLVQIFNRRRDVQQQQATQTAPHHLLLFQLVIKQFDSDTVSFIHQRRPGFHLIVAALLFIAFRQVAKAPDVQSVLFDTVVSNRRERLLNFALQRIFQIL